MIIDRRVAPNLFKLLSRPLSQIYAVRLCHAAFRRQFDLNQLGNDQFISQLRTNLKCRRSDLNVDYMLNLYNQYLNGDNDVESKLLFMANQIPNQTSPLTPVGDISKARQIYLYGSKLNVDWKPKDILELTTISKSQAHVQKCVQKTPESPISINPRGHMRTKNLTYGAGQRTFYFGGPLAQLEMALIAFTLDRLKRAGLALVSVPDVIPEAVISACGFPTRGKRSQVYSIVSPEESLPHCLSGTSEMALAGFCAGRSFNVDSDEVDVGDSVSGLGMCAISRCFRREVSNLVDIPYRVHQFNKVEMFALTPPILAASNAMFDQLLQLQINLLVDLELHFRALEMPSEELGNSAYRKVDIEVWMPGKNAYGEVSSASNCLDYQSRRLNIRWPLSNTINSDQFAYTLNGTACAIPRIVKSIVETHQTKEGRITIPNVLKPFMKAELEKHNLYPPVRLAHITP